MEKLSDMYHRFKQFLDSFLIRRAEGKFSADDFHEDKSEYIRTHLLKLLPSLTLIETLQMQIYFNDVSMINLSDGIGKPALLSHLTLSQTPIIDEIDEESSCAKRLKTQSQITSPSSLSLQANDTEQTPLESLDQRRMTFPIMQSTPLDKRRMTVPIMQSTPLSVPTAREGKTRTLSEHQTLDMVHGDDFFDDIISQIHHSPIAQVHPELPKTIEKNYPHSEIYSHKNAQVAEIPFLTDIIDLLKHSSQSKLARPINAQEKTRNRLPPITESFLRRPKKAMKKIDFEVLCSLAQKQRTEVENKRASESFLYFALMPGKTKNIIKRIINNVAIQEGECGHIPMERIIHFSNVLRAYASQSQSAVEQPGQTSLQTMFRSPCTPQALLRTSQLQPFTPTQCDDSSQSIGIEMEQISSLPMRSMLRQQSLFTIPERDATIPIPLSPQFEEIPLNNSLINIPLPENISTIPSDMGQDMFSHSNLPREIREDIEILDDQLLTSHFIVPTDNAVVPMELDELDPIIEVPSQNNVRQINDYEDNIRFNWFEALRPRDDIVYPLVDGDRRKKNRKRKRKIAVEEPIHELPELPMRTDSNSPHIGPPDVYSEQITQIPEPDFSDGMASEFNDYFKLIEKAVKNPKYSTWERFNPYLFSENDNFEMYTYIFKRIIKDDFVAMDTLYEKDTSRLEAAKGFYLILELKTMGIVEIEAVDTRIMGFKFRNDDNSTL